MGLLKFLRDIFEAESNPQSSEEREIKKKFYNNANVREGEKAKESNPQAVKLSSSVIPDNMTMEEWQKGGFSKVERDYKLITQK